MEAISATSSQLRKESAEVYYARNSFQLSGIRPASNNLSVMQDWADAVGMANLGHLRRLHVYLNFYKETYFEFLITYTPAKGLRAEVTVRLRGDRGYDSEDERKAGDAWCAVIEE